MQRQAPVAGNLDHQAGFLPNVANEARRGNAEYFGLASLRLNFLVKRNC